MSDPSPSPTVPTAGGGQGPSPDDVISGALQEALNEENEEVGHMVMDWILIANVIRPNGAEFTHLRFRDQDVSWPMSVGLIEYARLMLQQELAAQVEEEEEGNDD